MDVSVCEFVCQCVCVCVCVCTDGSYSLAFCLIKDEAALTYTSVSVSKSAGCCHILSFSKRGQSTHSAREKHFL